MCVDFFELDHRQRDPVELFILKNHVADLQLRVFGYHSIAQGTDPLDSNYFLKPVLENDRIKVLYHDQLA